MATNGDIARARRGIPWRLTGWGFAAALLLLPAIAMQFTREVTWDETDFIAWGLMLGTIGGLFELAVRMSSNWAYRAGFGLALLGAFLVTWANLAVGIVGSDDNPNNAMFFWALTVGILGAAVARLKPAGMALAMFATAAALGVAFVVAQAGPTDEPWVMPIVEAFGTGLFALMFIGSGLLFRKAAAGQS